MKVGKVVKERREGDRRGLSTECWLAYNLLKAGNQEVFKPRKHDGIQATERVYSHVYCQQTKWNAPNSASVGFPVQKPALGQV